MSKLNYHHLYYFWHVAKVGNLTRAAQQLYVSQSALSTQIKQLESTMDVQLFERQGRKLVLTAAGQQAFTMASDIFQRGQELEAWLTQKGHQVHTHLRIGTVSTMSRNFIEQVVTPLLRQPNMTFNLHSSDITSLLNELANHQLDLVLSNVNVASNRERVWHVQQLAQQPLSIIGPADKKPSGTFPEGYTQQRWVTPGVHSEMYASFAAFCSRHRFEPDILASADDMASLRLLARDSGALAVLPNVVVKDELASGALVEYIRIPDAYERFYGITLQRQMAPTALTELLNNLSM
ncbi:LysR family transcriptional regulator [Aestuariibacter halophilus]|uniref:LysR family transcriptional regulator n=1 Tax=Fluctibacter halophilus TaxID=226011 RepID=A0ABS8GGJ8_9ALTE|nr:LysR family transcriptional regulator [Aestuariibacter halophilus]MCC2618301.1 LysR family transcriptional regulator [Aestuariibacter halophilus]